jgi:hypothetical protein
VHPSQTAPEDPGRPNEDARCWPAQTTIGSFSVVHGYINGPGDYADENRASIAALPADDTWPYLTRDLFAVPSQKHSYYEQLITFGTIYNGVERAWEGWLGKFEALLQTMYWYEARVHLETDSWGTYHYVWTSLSPIAVKSGAPGLYGVALYSC